MKRILTVLAASALISAAYAQNLNRSVEVSNAFIGKTASSGKQCLEMSVPDSLHRFNLKFDYSVFDSPYGSRYTFKPYTVKFFPSGPSYSGSTWYFNVGCGWPLMPDFEAVYAPKPKGSFRYGVWNSFSGYFGDFHSFCSADGVPSDEYWYGMDMSERLGVFAENRFSGSLLSMSATADFTCAHDEQRVSGGYVGAEVILGLKNTADVPVDYDLNFSWKLGLERNVLSELNENLIRLYGTVVPSFILRGIRFAADFDLGSVTYTGALSAGEGSFVVVPRTMFKILGCVDAGVGFKVSVFDRFRIYPDIRFDWMSPGSKLHLLASITGGDSLCDFASFKESNHFFTPKYAQDFDFSGCCRSIDAHLGAEASLSTVFQFSSKAGWTWNADKPLYGIGAHGMADIKFRSYHELYALARGCAQLGPISVDGGIMCRKSYLDVTDVFGLPRMSADIALKYRYRSRIFAEVSLDALSGRDIIYGGNAMSLPSYHNLCARAEYRFGRRMGVWVKGQNLLGHFVEQMPMCARRGVDVTAGISCTLR